MRIVIASAALAGAAIASAAVALTPHRAHAQTLDRYGGSTVAYATAPGPSPYPQPAYAAAPTYPAPTYAPYSPQVAAAAGLRTLTWPGKDAPAAAAPATAPMQAYAPGIRFAPPPATTPRLASGATLPASGGVQPPAMVLRPVPVQASGEGVQPSGAYAFAPAPARAPAPTSIYSDGPAAASPGPSAYVQPQAQRPARMSADAPPAVQTAALSQAPTPRPDGRPAAPARPEPVAALLPPSRIRHDPRPCSHPPRLLRSHRRPERARNPRRAAPHGRDRVEGRPERRAPGHRGELPMSQAHSRLADLVSLGAEQSSERRREVLRQVTDLFMATPETLQAQAAGAFDAVMQNLSKDMELVVRAELAQRLAPVANAPIGVLRSLAADDIAVAGPVLRHSVGLSEADLLGVVRRDGQAHLQAVSLRRALPETVSDVIVERGDDATLGVLLSNPDAALSRHSAEAVVDRAHANPALHQAVVDRANLPADLLNEMYFTVEAQLRRKISARNAAMDPADLEAALAAGRRRLAAQDGALPPDYADAEIFIRGLKASGASLPNALPGMLRANERTRFLIALSELADIEFLTTARIVERRDLEALAILCKAANLDRGLYLTIVVLVDEAGKGLAKADEYGPLYNKLTRDTALRTLRFWRMRREGDLAA